MKTRVNCDYRRRRSASVVDIRSVSGETTPKSQFARGLSEIAQAKIHEVKIEGIRMAVEIECGKECTFDPEFVSSEQAREKVD
jgi:hypothetical protein